MDDNTVKSAESAAIVEQYLFGLPDRVSNDSRFGGRFQEAVEVIARGFVETGTPPPVSYIKERFGFQDHHIEYLIEHTKVLIRLDLKRLQLGDLGHFAWNWRFKKLLEWRSFELQDNLILESM